MGSIRTAILSVAGVVAISKILGFLREVVIADAFGTSAQYDLYLLAIILPALLYGVLNFAAYYVFVPFLSRVMGEEADRGSPWPLMLLFLIGSFVLTAVIVAAAPWLTRIWTSGYTPQDAALVVFYCRVTAAIIILGTTEAVMRATLHVRRIFAYPVTGYIIYNGFAILAVLLLADEMSVGAVALGLVGGLLLQNLFLIIRWFGLRPAQSNAAWFSPKNQRAMLAGAGVIILVELINRSYFMIDRYFAPTFGDGVVSALNYAQVLVALPDSIVGLAIASVVYPMFSDQRVRADDETFIGLYSRAVLGGLFIAVPAALVMAISATDITYLLFSRGQFDAESVVQTASVLRPLSLSVIALFVISSSIRACYSRQKEAAVFLFTIVLFASKLFLTWWLQAVLSYPGIALATSLSQIMFAALMFAYILKMSNTRLTVPLLSTLGRMAVAGAAAAGAGWLAASYTDSAIAGGGHLYAAIRIICTTGAVATGFVIVVYIVGLGPLMQRIVRDRHAGGLSGGTTSE